MALRIQRPACDGDMLIRTRLRMAYERVTDELQMQVAKENGSFLIWISVLRDWLTPGNPPHAACVSFSYKAVVSCEGSTFKVADSILRQRL